MVAGKHGWLRVAFKLMLAVAILASARWARAEGQQSVLAAPSLPTLTSGSYIAQYDASVATVNGSNKVTLWPNLISSSYQATLDAAPGYQPGGGPLKTSSISFINGLLICGSSTPIRKACRPVCWGAATRWLRRRA
jgi:hypothetical protein